MRVEGVSLTAGATKTVAVTSSEAFLNLSLDEIAVTTADHHTLAQPHRAALALTAGDRAALLAYLRQLDGQPEEKPAPILFADGFESGDLARWSAFP